jgi:hypothetical protein
VELIFGKAPEACAGSGSGSGYGSGSGGYGEGSGYGYGDGSGYGYGDGSGSGYGYGDGYGDGDGAGYGDGYGYGSGSGYGDGSYWASTLACFLSRLPVAAQARALELRQAGALLAFWLSDASGRPSNGGSCQPVKPGMVHRESGPLRDDCGIGQLHATLIPTKWQGERWWIVALIGERRGDDEKYWALEREIIGECV